MNTFWRCLVVCVLALALPLQSVAAAAMWHCLGSSSESSASAHLQAHQTPASPAHLGALEAEADCHGHGQDAAADLGHQCSACAYCCLGHALPAAAPLLSTAEPAAAPAVAPAVMVEAACCDTLERPPRC